MGSHRIARVLALSITLMLTIGLLAQPAVAQEQSAARKAGRALAALSTGFLEIPGNMVKGTRDRSLGYGVTMGFVKGLGALIPRYLVGVYELLTCPFPVPKGFEPLVTPEFPWGYFEAPPPKR